MLNKELGGLLAQQDRDVQQAVFKNARIEAISKGLDWEGAAFLQVPTEIQREINETIDDQLCRLVNYFDIPYPRISLMQNWNDVPFEGDRPMKDFLADSIVDDERIPNGLIRISPAYIKSLVSHQINPALMPKLPLEALMGHEGLHLWQWKEPIARKKLKRDLRQSGLGKILWEHTDSEIAAREFETSWYGIWQNYSPVIDVQPQVL